jgi:hypothetical protein
METGDDLSIGGDGPCSVCKKPIPKLTRRGIENIRLVCCGKLICHCLSAPITVKENGMTTTSALCDIDKCPLCKKPSVYTNSKEFHDRTMKHVLDGKAWAQYSHACTLIDTDSPEELASNGPAALRLATLCAERGYSYAYFLLGCMYEEGNGIPKSEPQALHWYKKSAKAGNA